ncbi:restriction endonuclease [Acidovorax sp. HDW3]|uniref:restriction endonuclease n=1 Tax=Acidovorax sp. HDW3 TaxID=2714923 RepID=UPI00140E726F|nr:restriction endonuclease [Acidovorax sp. HDW3]QIL43168.1 restriction endonuclease [Acidovorax sp. HDW3]
MRIEFRDYNGADVVINSSFGNEWRELQESLEAMPLHLKASDQDGLQGNAIFDVVGTNAAIQQALVARGWRSGTPIPNDLGVLGVGIDFAKNGVLAEVQFSNYPFFFNNAVRSETFFRNGTVFHDRPTGLIIIIAKSGCWPASNSTLYYEQAVAQMNTIHAGIFTAPMRLVGLMGDPGQQTAMWTQYSSARYSRTVASNQLTSFDVRRSERSDKFKITQTAGPQSNPV